MGFVHSTFHGKWQAADILLTIGGVSKGTHDLVHGLLSELGVEEVFLSERLSDDEKNRQIENMVLEKVGDRYEEKYRFDAAGNALAQGIITTTATVDHFQVTATGFASGNVLEVTAVEELLTPSPTKEPSSLPTDVPSALPSAAPTTSPTPFPVVVKARVNGPPWVIATSWVVVVLATTVTVAVACR